MKYWFGYLTAAIFGAITWVLMRFGERFSTLVDMVYPYVIRTSESILAQWASGADFPVWQLLAVALGALILASIVLMIVLKWNPIQWGGWVLAFFAGIYMLHTMLWGLNYYSGPLSDDMRLDVGSVGKGYAVEMVCQAAEARGLTSALVSVGGNLRAIGVKPDGSQWTGGVENPWSSSDVYTSDSMLDGAINMSDMALVTSGDYQRYYVVDGVRYHHLIDPATLWPAAYFNGVSVLAPDSGVADCLTTGLFCMPLEEGQKIVESLDGVEALWCTTDGQLVTSSGWSSHEKK